MERAKGIEPSYEAWEASVLPLNYARTLSWTRVTILEASNPLPSESRGNATPGGTRGQRC
jgi:hypothetical protein